MIKISGIVLLLLGLFVSAAQADTIHLGQQYGLPNGYSEQQTGCVDQSSGQCATIPTGKSIKQCTGTHTIKTANIELLAVLVCGRPDRSRVELIWVGHHLSSAPTVMYSTPMLPLDSLLTGDGINACWIEYQAINSGPATVPNGGWEMHALCTAE